MNNLIRPEEAARRLGVSRQSIYKRIERKQIPVFHLGRSVYIDWDELCDTMRKARSA